MKVEVFVACGRIDLLPVAMSGDGKCDALGTITCQCGKKTIPIPDAACVSATYHCGPRCASHHRGLRDPENIAFKQKLELFVDLPPNSRKWFDLAAEFGIDAIMVKSLAEVVSERRWRNSASPIRYLRTTTERRFKAASSKALGINDPFDQDGQRRCDRCSTCFSDLPLPADDDGNIQDVNDFVDHLALQANEDERYLIAHKRVPESLRDYQTITSREQRENALLLATLRTLNGAMYAEDMNHLKLIPELTSMLDDGMLEAALGVSRGFTYGYFLENGARRAVGLSVQKRSTSEERRSRQAAWRRLSRMKKSSPSLRRTLEELAAESRRYMDETPAQKRRRKKLEAEAARLLKVKETVTRERHNAWQLERHRQPEVPVERHLHLAVEPKPTLFAGVKPKCQRGHSRITESAGRQRCRDCGEWLGTASNSLEDVLVVASPVPTSDQS